MVPIVARLKVNKQYLGGTSGREPIYQPMQETYETPVRSLGWEDPLEDSMATHSSIVAWRIPWTEESVGLQAIESQSQTWLK